MVTISEVVAVVNASIGGCQQAQVTPTRTATPTRTPTVPASCPFRFNQAVGTDRFCAYSGPVDTECGPFAQPVESGWTTVGTTVVFVMFDRSGTIAAYARRTSPTAATVQTVAFGPDFDVEYTATGTISLPSQSRVRAVMDSARFACGDLDHTGDFDTVLTEGAGAQVNAALVQRSSAASELSAVARQVAAALHR